MFEKWFTHCLHYQWYTLAKFSPLRHLSSVPWRELGIFTRFESLLNWCYLQESTTAVMTEHQLSSKVAYYLGAEETVLVRQGHLVFICPLLYEII